MNQLDREFLEQLVRGNVALWIAESADFDILSHSNYEKIKWLAIWSQSRSANWANKLDRFRRTSDILQLLVEVPDRLESALGSGYSFSQFTPFYYLNGNGDGWSSWSNREIRRAQDEKIDEIERLKKSELLIVGFDKARDLADLLLEELPHSADVKYILENKSDAFISDLVNALKLKAPVLLNKIRILSEDLSMLLGKAADNDRIDDYAQSTAIKVGETNLKIDSFLEQESPIDQSFKLILSDNINETSGTKPDHEILEDFIAGRGSPWLAIKKGLLWNRFENSQLGLVDSSPLSWVLGKIKAISGKNSPKVQALAIASEKGAGLTTTLQRIAFTCASQGFPTLIYREQSDSYDYDALRIFLERIQRSETGLIPALIVIDETQKSSNSLALSDLADRLASDGRSALVLKGIPAGNHKFEDIISENKIDGSVLVSPKIQTLSWNGVLRADLGSEEISSLTDWVCQYWGHSGSEHHAILNALKNWSPSEDTETNKHPFLVCLYLILKEKLTYPSMIGRHIIEKVVLESNVLREELIHDAKNRPLTKEELKKTIIKLHESLNSIKYGPHSDLPSPSVFEKVFITLCVFSTLKVYPPIISIVDVVDSTLDEVNGAITKLCNMDLVDRFSDPSVRGASMSARSVYYLNEACAGLRHPIFGILVLEALNQNQSLSIENYMVEVLDNYHEGVEYQLDLLKWAFPKLSPREANLGFVAAISSSLLRYQRVAESSYHDWLFNEKASGKLVTVLDVIPPVLSGQSASILHSKGLTRYKSVHSTMDIEEARKAYSKASKELSQAYELIDTEGDSSDDRVAILTSHGLLYRAWCKFENENCSSQADTYRTKAVELLKDALKIRPNNAHAAGALAGIYIDSCEDYSDADRSTKGYADKLAAIFEYLQYKPPLLFKYDWEQNYKRAIALCKSERTAEVIDFLKRSNNDLWRALKSLSLLEGIIPSEVTEEKASVEKYTEAFKILGMQRGNNDQISHLADLLRYAVYSALPESRAREKYSIRYELIKKLDWTKLVSTPIFLFDYAMLSYQVGEYNQGEQIFQELRKGRKFIDVPMERSQYLVDPTNPKSLLKVSIRVTKVHDIEYCWGAIMLNNFKTSVRFHKRDYKQQNVQHGHTLLANLQIRSAGPQAVQVIQQKFESNK